jgi:hypothetical protein
MADLEIDSDRIKVPLDLERIPIILKRELILRRESRADRSATLSIATKEMVVAGSGCEGRAERNAARGLTVVSMYALGLKRSISGKKLRFVQAWWN